MGRQSILTEMYNNGVALSERIKPKGPAYDEHYQIREEKEKQLLDSLNKEQQKLFEEWKQTWFSQEFYFDDENYRQGFYLGLQIASEAFILKD